MRSYKPTFRCGGGGVLRESNLPFPAEVILTSARMCHAQLASD